MKKFWEIEPIYFEVEGTPLKYHNALKVLLPVFAILLALMGLMNMKTNVIVGLLCTIVALVLIFTANSMKKFMWRGVVLFYIVCVLNVISAVIGLVQGDSTYLFSLAGALALLICTYIYYSHRRPLFNPY